MNFIQTAFFGVTTAIVAAAASPVQAANISSTTDLVDTIRNEMGIKCTVTESSIEIEYSDAPTIFIHTYDGSKKVAPNRPGKFSRIAISCCIGYSSDRSDFNSFVRAANKFNEEYTLKAYAVRHDGACMILMERNEFVSSAYTRQQFRETYSIFCSLASRVKSGEVELDL